MALLRRRRPSGQALWTTAHTLRGPEPIGLSAEQNIDENYGIRLAGANAPARIGMPTYGVNRFSGDCGPVQDFSNGGVFAGATNPRGSINEAQLPGNPTALTQANPVLSAMLNNGVAV